MGTLFNELLDSNEFFDMLVDIIPAKLYISGQSGDDFNPKNRFHSKSNKEDSKEARKAAAKLAKRRKLDPSQAESTVQTKERVDLATNPAPILPPKLKKMPSIDDDIALEQSPHLSRVEALRAKLRAKIAEKQALRPASSPDQVSKRAARRAEKRRRQEEAAKRKKMSGTSRVDDLRTAAAHYRLAGSRTVEEDLMNLDFGRLSGLNKPSSENYAATNKSLANLSKGKNLKKMLADAEEKRKKLKELKKGTAKEQAKAAAMEWVDTLKEADGQRIKDDPAKLKKSLKRKIAKKTKSQKAWKTRMEQTTASKDERQKIRQHNLSARKQGGAVGANLSKKKIADGDRDADGGRRLSRAGFEGRKREFLNSPKDQAKDRGQ